MWKLGLVIIIIVLVVWLNSARNESYVVQDYRPHVYFIYKNSPLADYFLENLGNSDAVAARLLHATSTADIEMLRTKYNLPIDRYPQMIIVQKGQATVINHGIKLAIDDLMV